MLPVEMEDPAVDMLHITKQFPGVLANDRVCFSARRGELHAIVGENGAGKTTLMNILYGLHRPDSGEIRVFGKPVQILSPLDAIALRIGMVHQHFTLVPALTTLENVILGAEPVRFGRTDYARAEKKVAEICRRFGLDVDLRSPAGQASVSSQQKAEILKALYRDAQILILDEPTSVLAPQESESLFRMLRDMVSQGMCVILISHKLQDVTTYADRITVLRRGRSVACVAADATTPDELARLMVGDDSSCVATERVARAGGTTPLLKVCDLSVLGDRRMPAVRNATFEIHAGEILGVAGVDGNGQRELVEALVGLRPAAGRVILDGEDILRLSVRRRLERGLAFVPEDRSAALILEDPIDRNSILGMHRDRPFSRLGMLSLQAMTLHATTLVEAYGIRAPGIRTPVKFLSGGNQQKLVLGRALSRHPRLLIACQPTRGLDVRAASEIHSRLLDACAHDAGVLLVSHDLDELLALCDRVMVMFMGRVMGILPRDMATRENLGVLMLGAEGERGED